MGKFLVAFDFDYTVIKENSDFIVRNLLPPEIIKDRLQSYDSRGWTSYMGEIFQILHELGFKEENIRDVITSISAVPDFIFLFKALSRLSGEIIIISDSNTYFIEEWLKTHGIRDTVSQIYSNPAEFKDGMLRIEKYHVQDWCKLSTINLCKGSILLSHIEKRALQGLSFQNVFYVGDGHNDLCPSLKLNENDIIFPRVGFPLLEQLKRSQFKVKAKVIPWENSDIILRNIEAVL